MTDAQWKKEQEEKLKDCISSLGVPECLRIMAKVCGKTIGEVDEMGEYYNPQLERAKKLAKLADTI